MGKVNAMLPENDLSKLTHKEILAEARERRISPTFAEKRILKLLGRKRMLGLSFRFQHVSKKDIFDFYCPELKVVIEVDYSVGNSHCDYYRERDERLQAYGIHVLRYKNDEIMDRFNYVKGNIQDQLYELWRKKIKKKIAAVHNPTHIQPNNDPIPGPSPLEGKGARTAGGKGLDFDVPRNIKDLIIGQARYMRSHPTRAEALLWGLLRMKQLQAYKFRRQHIIGTYIVDFYCPTGKLIVEVDGPIHQTQQVYDVSRELNLIAMGYRILRFTNDEVIHHTDEVLRKITQYLA